MTTVPKFGQWIVALAVIVSLLLFYTGYDKKTQALDFGKTIQVISFQDLSFSLKELNKVAALAGIGLLAITFLMGPLSRMFPKKFARFLVWRKFLGLFGFGLIALHVLYSVIFIYNLSLDQMIFNNPKLEGILAGVIAFVIFMLMALTSTQKSVEKMGYANWKKLQTTGYIALFLSAIHFVILETKPEIGLDVRPFGKLFLALAIIALMVRIGLIFVQIQQRTQFGEHVGELKQDSLKNKKTN
ncbi:MAG: ferric reductase-like transmembrane domain-containing protein [Candidatus Diapherotrites archaeon]|nr:ferric reductase-like transmembrane domain-containing protein [Candidatus Diapherotrites archaeon]